MDVSRKIKEAQFEAVLRLAVIENFEREMENIPSNHELDKMYIFSERHVKRMNKLFERSRRKDMLKAIWRTSYRVAAIFLVIISLTFGALMLNDDVRAAVSRVLVQWFDEFTRFRIYRDVTDTISDANGSWQPSYLPDGFTEYSVFMGAAMIAVDYLSAENITISFVYARVGAITFDVDNENRFHRIERINNIDYHVFKSTVGGVQSVIIWEYDGFMFLIESLYDVNELLEVAISVQ